MLPPSVISCFAAVLVFFPDEAPPKVTVVPRLWVSRTLAADFARRELFLETLGGELGKAAVGVTQFALGRVLFSMSFC